MSPRIASAVACLLAVASPAPAVGFAPSSSTSSSTSLRMSSLSSAQHVSEDAYPQFLGSASVCAHDDGCSIESAEYYLREIVHVQSGCAAGTLSGNGVCEDVQGVSEVVADLRKKIGDGAQQEVRTFWDQRQDEFETLAVASLDGSSSASGALTAPLKPAYLALAALYAVAVIAAVQPAVMDASAGGVVPFTAQEVWWAVRDGYVGDLTHHLFQNGGLVVGDAAAAAGSSLSPQEVAWSIRDGYAADTLFASGGEGGGVESVPFAPREVWWAVRDGYGSDLVEHWFRNGGLSL